MSMQSSGDQDTSHVANRTPSRPIRHHLPAEERGPMRSTVPTPRQAGLPSRGQRAIVLMLLAVLFGAILAQSGFAAERGAKIISLGESLTPEQQKELLDYFGATNDDKVQTITVADTQDAMKGIINTPILSAYSSTSLTCRDLGDGLEVKTHNINLITPSMFAMALVTAGIGDAELVVASPDGYAAQGMTALAGMFKTWGSKPCRSGLTSKARQQLALEELALTVSIAQALDQQNGTTNGIVIAGDLVLYTQQSVVIDGLTTSDQISQAIADQEAIKVVKVPDALRAQLVDLMVRIANEKIDWSTFSAGWEITPTNDGTGISMVGDGIAIRNAQMTATVKAAENRTATAEAKAAKSATAEAEAALTQTAQAEGTAQTGSANATANAQATQDASASQTAEAAAAMTSTALAQPTATATPQPTATPEPTATPAPIAVTGQVVEVKGGQVWVDTDQSGGPPTGYTVPVDASISRSGKSAALSDIKKGDTVSLSVDDYTKTVRKLAATPKATSAFASLSKFLFLLPALAVIPLILFIRGRGGMGDPFVVKRVASA
jgi:uncharacterized protein YpuA (DUF1002 family)